MSKVTLKRNKNLPDKGLTRALEAIASLPKRPKPAKFKVGDIVRMGENHPFARMTGEVVRMVVPKLLPDSGERPVVRLHDMNDHECFVMNDREAKVLK